jgi:hypothetical protein
MCWYEFFKRDPIPISMCRYEFLKRDPIPISMCWYEFLKEIQYPYHAGMNFLKRSNTHIMLV